MNQNQEILTINEYKNLKQHLSSETARNYPSFASFLPKELKQHELKKFFYQELTAGHDFIHINKLLAPLSLKIKVTSVGGTVPYYQLVKLFRLPKKMKWPELYKIRISSSDLEVFASLVSDELSKDSFSYIHGNFIVNGNLSNLVIGSLKS